MPTPSMLYAVRPESSDPASFDDGLIFPVLSRWPDAPASAHIARSTLTELLAEQAAGARLRGVALVALDGSEPPDEIHALADMLGATALPAVVLAPDEDLFVADHLSAEGAIVLPPASAPETVALTLRALHARQPVVDRLSRELHVAQAAMHGAAQQMSHWQEEMELAAQIQRELMPRSAPNLDALDIGVVYRPAGYVSGDIFDVRPVGSRSIAFFIADAVGHGVPAALMTLLVARAVRGLDPNGDALDPEAALTHLNRELCEQQSGRQRFVTAVYGVYDPSARRVRLAGAGHPPPILARPVSVERIETEGPLLGVFEDARFPAVEFTLTAEDLLVLFSDGFETAFPDPEAHGRQLRLPTRRYIERLVGCRSEGSTLSQAARTLELDLDAQAGSLHQPDDVTALFLAPSAAAAPVTGPVAGPATARAAA